MPGAEDYQALFGQLQGEQNVAPVSGQPANPTPAPVVMNPEPPAPVASVDPTAPAVEPTTPTGEGTPANPAPATPSLEDEEARKQNAAFAQLRSTNTKYSSVFKTLQERMGAASEEEVINRLLDTSLQLQAKKEGIDPALLKRINTLEETNVNMMAQQKQAAVANSFGLVQKEFNLSNEDTIKYARELDAAGVDIFAANIDLVTLYRGMHYEEITKKQIEAEKQNWIKDNAAANAAPGINPIAGKKTDGTKTEIKTLGELDTILQNFNK